MAKDVRIALTFDYDAMSNWIGSSGAKSPGMISRGEFGPIALRRILALLERRAIHSTFFVPGHTARAYPDTVRAIHAAGHEIGHHGWVHENPVTLTPAQERVVLQKGLDALHDVAGVRPVGYRSPGWDNSPVTVPLLVEFGFEYESSLMGSDFEPYWCRVGDEFSTTEEFRWGTPVNLIELPVAWHLDDFIQFEFVATPTGILNAARSTTMSWEIWTQEFEYLYDRIGKGLMTITMHPQVIGRGHRLLFLERFIDFVASRPGVRFTTLREYAREWRAGRTPALPADAGPARAPGPARNDAGRLRDAGRPDGAWPSSAGRHRDRSLGHPAHPRGTPRRSVPRPGIQCRARPPLADRSLAQARARAAGRGLRSRISRAGLGVAAVPVSR